MSEKKYTVIKKLTERDYIRALWVLGHPQEYKDGLIIDLADVELPKDMPSRRCFYVTKQEKEELLDDFCNRIAKPKSRFEEFMAELGIKEYKTVKFK